MIVEDEGCVSEQTILRYQTNNIAELLGCAWYGILLFSPRGHIVVDTCYEVKLVETQKIEDALKKVITRTYLDEGACKCFDLGEDHFMVYPIRKNEKGYYIFFAFYRNDAPFEKKDVMWYETYARTAYQRVLLENELVQDKNLIQDLFQYIDRAILIVLENGTVVQGSRKMESLVGKDIHTCEDGKLKVLSDAISEVIRTGKSSSLDASFLPYMDKGGSLVILPFSNSKGKIGAAVVIERGVA